MDAATNPTWGYKPDGSAEIFDLAPGEGLPDGWHASPDCITDPDLATAEALTARAEGRDYVLPAADPVSGFRVESEAGATIDPDALANALAEINRLTGIIAAGTAENDHLLGDIVVAEKAVEAASEEVSALRSQVEGAEKALDAAASEVSSLRAALATASDEKSAALASVEALTADLAKAKADLDEILAAPPADAKAGKAGK